jgi:hypothetical protein
MEIHKDERHKLKIEVFCGVKKYFFTRLDGIISTPIITLDLTALYFVLNDQRIQFLFELTTSGMLNLEKFSVIIIDTTNIILIFYSVNNATMIFLK